MSVAQPTPAVDPTSLPTRTKSRKTRAASRPKEEASKVLEKCSWYVSPEARKRVAIHAAMEGKSQSDIVNEVLEALNRYSMPAVNTRASRASQPPADTGEDRQGGAAA